MTNKSKIHILSLIKSALIYNRSNNTTNFHVNERERSRSDQRSVKSIKNTIINNDKTPLKKVNKYQVKATI